MKAGINHVSMLKLRENRSGRQQRQPFQAPDEASFSRQYSEHQSESWHPDEARQDVYTLYQGHEQSLSLVSFSNVTTDKSQPCAGFLFYYSIYFAASRNA